MSVAQSLRRRLDKLREPSLSGTLVRGVGASFIIMALGQVLGAILQVVLARSMGRVQYGLFTWVSAWIPALVVVVCFGLPQAGLRFLPEYAEQGDGAGRDGFVRYSRTLIFISSIVLAAIGTVILFAVRAHHRSAYEMPLLVGLWTVPLAAQSALMSQLLRAVRRIAWAFGPPRIAQPLFLIAGVLTLRFLGVHPTGIEALAISWLVLFASLAIQYGLFRRDMGTASREARPVFDSRKWMRVALPLMSVIGCQIVFSQVDILTVGWLMHPANVAVYGAANRIVNFVEFGLAITNVAFGPEASALYARGDIAGLQRAVRLTARLAFWSGLPATIALVLFGRTVLTVFGHNYMSGYHVLCVLAAGSLVNAACGPVSMLLNMTGHERTSSRILCVCAALDVILNIVLVHYRGMIGAAIASAGTLALWNIWLAIACRRLLSIDTVAFLAK